MLSQTQDIVDNMAQDLGTVSFPSSLVYQVFLSRTGGSERPSLGLYFNYFSLAGSFYGLFQYSCLAAVNQFAI